MGRIGWPQGKGDLGSTWQHPGVPTPTLSMGLGCGGGLAELADHGTSLGAQQQEQGLQHRGGDRISFQGRYLFLSGGASFHCGSLSAPCSPATTGRCSTGRYWGCCLPPLAASTRATASSVLPHVGAGAPPLARGDKSCPTRGIRGEGQPRAPEQWGCGRPVPPSRDGGSLRARSRRRWRCISCQGRRWTWSRCRSGC